MKILVLGCGGIGSELVKLLIIKNETSITLLDYDDIEISNLNRQFMFLHKDIGKNKAEVLCFNVNHRRNTKYQFINTDILRLGEEDINPFDIIISCLDNITARMHINFLIKKSVKNIHFIDSGIENTKIHIKIVKKELSCLYCIKEMYNTQRNLSFCTIKNIEKNTSKYSRQQIILSLILKFKEKNENKSNDNSNSQSDLTESVKSKFNELAISNNFKPTNSFEIIGIEKDIVPNVCYINSIAASLILKEIETIEINKNYDYIFYNSEYKIYTQKLLLSKSDTCILCSKDK